MKPLEMLVNSRGPILSQLLLLSISITDTFVLGFLGSEELAVGGLLNNYALLFYLVITGLSISILIVNGRKVGEGDLKGISSNLASVLLLFFLMGLLGTAIFWNIGVLIEAIAVFESNPLWIDSYSRTLAVSLGLSCIAVSLRYFLISLEETKYLDLLFLSAFVLNLIFDLLLSGVIDLGASLGVIGIPFSSLLINLYLIIILLWCVLTSPLILTKYVKTTFSNLLALIHIGLPISAILFFEAILFIGSHTIAASNSLEGAVTFSLFIIFVDLIIMFAVGISQSISSKISINIGRAKSELNRDLIINTFWLIIIINLVLGILIGLSSFIYLHNFHDVKPILAQEILLASKYILPVALLNSLVIVLSSIFRSLKPRSQFGFNVVLGYGVIGLGSAFVLSRVVGLGNEGVYIGLLCGFAYSMIALLFDNKDIVKAEKLHGILKFGR